MNLPNAHSHHALSNFSPRPSRRALVTGALAGVFVLAFRLSLQAANEPQQPPDNPAGQFAPNAFIRIDHAGKTTLVERRGSRRHR
jgi:isoquinoline 1-oxidoreductase subunit beta